MKIKFIMLTCGNIITNICLLGWLTVLVGCSSLSSTTEAFSVNNDKMQNKNAFKQILPDIGQQLHFREKRGISPDDFKAMLDLRDKRRLPPSLFEPSSDSDKENPSSKRLRESREKKKDPTFSNVIKQNAFKASDHKLTRDSQGRTTSLTAQVEYVGQGKGTGKSTTAKLSAAETAASGYIPGVDAKGHMLSARLGGTGEKDYIFPQNGEVNNRMWKSQEGRMAANIKNNGPATVRTTQVRDGNEIRPSEVRCDIYRSNGKGCKTYSAPNPKTNAEGIAASEKFKKERSAKGPPTSLSSSGSLRPGVWTSTMFGGGRSSSPGAGTSTMFGGGRSSSPGAGKSTMFGGGRSSSPGAGTSTMFGGGRSSSPGAGTSTMFGGGRSSSPGAGTSTMFGGGRSSGPGAGTSSMFGGGRSPSSGAGSSMFGGVRSPSPGVGSSTMYGGGRSLSSGDGSSSMFGGGRSPSPGAGTSNSFVGGRSPSSGAGTSMFGGVRSPSPRVGSSTMFGGGRSFSPGSGPSTTFGGRSSSGSGFGTSRWGRRG